MLKVHTKKLGDVIVLCLKGQLVTGETASLRDAVLSQSSGNALVLDLARVSRIDAGGLGLLLELREQTLSKGMEFGLMNVTNLVQQVLEMTRLNSVLEVSSERGGLAAALHDRPTMVFETAPCA